MKTASNPSNLKITRENKQIIWIKPTVLSGSSVYERKLVKQEQ